MNFMKPPIALTVLLLGGATGLFVFIFFASNASSYLSNDPKACMNCHVMTTAFGTWERGNHKHVTVCNDCHVPQDSLVRKLFFKAQDGLRHAFMFTFHLEPQVIRIHEAGRNVVMENCERCHHNTIHRVSVDEGRTCWDCHRETPHGRVNSLSAAPYVRLPEAPSVLPIFNNKSKEK